MTFLKYCFQIVTYHLLKSQLIISRVREIKDDIERYFHGRRLIAGQKTGSKLLYSFRPTHALCNFTNLSCMSILDFQLFDCANYI
jgi:hypothetical protein